jgi:hypothetical protein
MTAEQQVIWKSFLTRRERDPEWLWQRGTALTAKLLKVRVPPPVRPGFGRLTGRADYPHPVLHA